ncbi:MAG: peptidoglycan DD-metalloendopeptidase family protein [Bacilli bacterium]|nr:peptidoglycan DD-metalloendopeptidase family protein [Bacilli bacterium]
MDNNDGNTNKGNAVDNINKVIQKAKKIKKLWPISSAAAPVLGWVLLGFLVVILLLIPILFLSEIVEAVATGYDKFLNLVTGEGFVTSENAFFKTLEREYNRFEALEGHEVEFDMPLLASTIHYSTITDPDAYNIDDDDAIKNEDYDYDRANPVVTPRQIRSFYIVANHELGSAYTLWPGQSKLIGHLIDTRFELECVSKPQGWDILNPSAWDEIVGAGRDLLDDFASHLQYTAEDTTKDFLTHQNKLKLISLIWNYRNQDKDYFISEFKDYKYEAFHDNFYANLFRIMGQSSLVNTCADDQLGLPALKKFINYNYYKENLMEYLPKQLYNTCNTCPYKLARMSNNKEEQERILKMQITEIFDQRDAYDYLYGKVRDGEKVYYIPGMASLPFMLGSGEDWNANLTSPFGWRKDPFTHETKYHSGLDFGYPTGTPVTAIADGLVMQSKMGDSYGNYVKLSHDLNNDHKPEYYSLYAHLSLRTVERGQMIGGGQKIGEVGSTGRSTGSHLHFEIMNDKGERIDPAPILEGIMRGNTVLDKPFTTKYYRQSLYSIYEYCPGMTTNENQTATILTSGALPTAYAMIISKLTKDIERDPPYVAKYICENTNYRVQGSGTSSNFYTDTRVQEHFNINSVFITKEKVTFEKIDSILSSGKPIIANVNTGEFDPSGKGHYVVLDNIDLDRKVTIYDPASMSKSGPYSKQDVEDLLISSIDEGIWYFERRK